MSLLVTEAVAIGRPARLSLVVTAASLVSAAILIAAAHALARRPAIGRTAAAIDDRLDLQDRVVTAVQFQGRLDSFSRLVVRDAVQRVVHAQPSHVFRFGVPRLARGMAIAAVAVAVVFLLGAVGAPRVWRMRGPGSDQTIAGGAASSMRADRAASGRSRTEDGTPSTTPSPDHTPPRADAAETRSAAGSSPAPPTRPNERAAEDELQAGNAAAGTQELRTSALGTRSDRDGGMRSTGRTGGASSDRTLGHGGVTGGALIAGEKTVPTRSPTSSPTNAKAYRAAWSKAQAAISQDKVPADLRGYVKRYFLAIRPPEQP